MSAREDFVQEFQEEKDAISDLSALESAFSDDRPLSGHVRALIWAYKRKHAEARELRGYLGDLKAFFIECWDEEDGLFEPYNARKLDSLISSHWCPSLIEEIGEMTEEGIVYPAPPVKVDIV